MNARWLTWTMLNAAGYVALFTLLLGAAWGKL